MTTGVPTRMRGKGSRMSPSSRATNPQVQSVVEPLPWMKTSPPSGVFQGGQPPARAPSTIWRLPARDEPGPQASLQVSLALLGRNGFESEADAVRLHQPLPRVDEELAPGLAYDETGVPDGCGKRLHRDRGEEGPRARPPRRPIDRLPARGRKALDSCGPLRRNEPRTSRSRQIRAKSAAPPPNDEASIPRVFVTARTFFGISSCYSEKKIAGGLR